MTIGLLMAGLACRLTASAIFALAAVHSMRSWSIYAGIVTQYRVVPAPVARAAAWCLPPLQMAAAIALLVPISYRAGAVLGLALLAIFTAAVAINVVRGRVAIECGCGGADGQQLSWGLVVRNLLVSVLLVMGLAAGPGGVDALAGWVGGVGASVFLVVLYFAANQMLANAQALHTQDRA